MLRHFSIGRRGHRPLSIVFLLAGLALVSAGGANAAQLTVCPSGCQYTTIAAALVAAHDGDTIAIGPGTYDGGFTVNVSVRLIGAGRNATTISGEASVGPSVVTIHRGASVRISRVTISGGVTFLNEGGGGVDNDGTLTLYETRVSGNVVDGGGGGVFNDRGKLTIAKSLITGNGAVLGGGIRNQGGAVVVRDSMITNNSANSGIFGGPPPTSGGGISNSGTIALVRTGIVDNASVTIDVATGGGISNDVGAVATLRDSWVKSNSTYIPEPLVTRGGGIYNLGTMTLRETPVFLNRVQSEVGDGYGGGIANGGTLTLVKSPVTRNSALTFQAFGGGISNEGTMNVRRSPISLNRATADPLAGTARGGGIRNVGSLTLFHSPVTANTAEGLDATGGGVFNALAAFLARIDSPVTGNIPNNCVGC